MTRLDAVRAIRAAVPDEAIVVACNGMIGRELFTAGDRPQHFYMIGSMGLASAIGLGLALARPARLVVVADGDGNVLMNMGMLAAVAAAAVPNLYHVVFDNASHASTGGQRTIADRVAIDRVALAAGYQRADRVSDPAALEPALRAWLAGPGPAMLVVQVDPGNTAGVGRVDIDPPAMARRVRASAVEGA